MTETDRTLDRVLESAARLQEVVPDAVLVGGTAAALHASHRDSFDHDPMLADLRERFDVVLDAIERTEGWVTNRIVPGKLILGELGDIEAGVRQLIRRRPLETIDVRLPSGRTVRAPTRDEALRVKAFLIVQRNQARDFIDVAALSQRMSVEVAGRVLAEIDAYYADQHGSEDGVASQLARQLAEPRPADASTTRELHRYRNLDPRWHAWSDVEAHCMALAECMLDGGESEP